MVFRSRQCVTADRGGAIGFTLLEIIFVLTLLAVISAIYVSQFTQSNVELIAGVESLKTHLRHAQARAMSTSGTWYVQFSPDGSPEYYSLYQHVEGGADDAMVFPGQSDASVSLPDGVTINVASGLVVSFDRLGRPFTDVGGTAALSGVWNVATSSIGNIEIKPETGYIP